MSITIEQLSESASAFLKIGTESACRVSVHQAYYSLFHRTLFLANTFLDAEISGASQHEKLCRFMVNQKNTYFRGIGKALQMAAGLRVKADYHLETDITLRDAEIHLVSCCKNLKKVEEYICRFSSSKI